ncbi:hypothetical protein Tco_0683247 [Tanacetum coccineum]|uniref:Reverse transcriptase domain-containing protein n=1 Tax=Tanacetum coccineum TaxID=301880 RepID=A0ABQ4XV66_9ASTR
MSAMANTTLIMTTVTKTATKEKMPKETDVAPRVNILDFCEEHYEDILPVIMDKNSSAGTLPASDTYSPSTTKSGPDKANSRDHSRSKGRSHRRDSSLSRDRPRSRDHSHDIEESYGSTCSSYRTEALHRSHSCDSDRSHIIKRGRGNESPLSRVSKSDTSKGGHWKRPRGSRENFPNRSIGRSLGNAYVMPYVQFYPNRGRETKEVRQNPVEIHNFKQKDRETIEDFMERFKVKTGRMRGAPECMRISGFMHGVINPELTKRLNEQVSKTMEEMMTATTAFIRGETAVASKKKGHTSWKPQDQSKRHGLERKLDFRGQPRKGRRSNMFTPFTRTPKEILAAEAGKFKPPPPMVTPVEKRSNNKFCDFHNDKGHITDEYM